MTGIFVGYQLAREKYAVNVGANASWKSWFDSRRAAREAKFDAFLQQYLAAKAAGQAGTTAATPEADPISAGSPAFVDAAEFALFQQWKASQQPFQATPSPSLTREVKAQVAITAEKALDAMLSQISDLKEVCAVVSVSLTRYAYTKSK